MAGAHEVPFGHSWGRTWGLGATLLARRQRLLFSGRGAGPALRMHKDAGLGPGPRPRPLSAHSARPSSHSVPLRVLLSVPTPSPTRAQNDPDDPDGKLIAPARRPPAGLKPKFEAQNPPPRPAPPRPRAPLAGQEGAGPGGGGPTERPGRRLALRRLEAATPRAPSAARCLLAAPAARDRGRGSHRRDRRRPRCSPRSRGFRAGVAPGLLPAAVGATGRPGGFGVFAPAAMPARPGPLWLLGLALCALSGGGPGPRPPPGLPPRRLGARERRDVQREILAVLGLPGRPRPRPRAPPAAARLPASAPLFMLDLYHAMAGGDDDDAARERRLGRADLVMSFVNMVERDCTLGLPEPHWKEFLFDLTQIPAGEAVTAAQFRIYKLPSSRPLNQTLHISVFEVLRELTNRESDLLFLDLQTLQAGDEGWLVLDVTAASDRWLLNRNRDLGLRLYVETEDGRSVDPGLAGLLGQRAPRSKQPFMVTFFRASPSPARAPRAVRPLKRRLQKKTNELPQQNKLPGIFAAVQGTEGQQVCRRHELYVSFRDLGWLDWVIAPQGYSAYYCEGECSFPLGSCMNATNHAILQSLVHLMKPDAVPKACCAPTKLSATSVLYYDSSNNVILRKHRNMVVKACGCH